MKIVINPAYRRLEEFVKYLPSVFPKEGNVIYSARNILKSFRVDDTDLVVKSFKVPIWVNKIAYGYFRKSKAARSYEYALEVLRRGGDTPDPVAYIEEYKWGMLYRSYYICLYRKEAETVRSYMDGSIPDADDVLRCFAGFTAGLHRKGILHIDYSPGNILLEKGEDGQHRFSVIDINRLCFKKVSRKEAYRNFSRLAVSEEVSTRLGYWYADCCALDKDEAIREVNRYSDRFFLKLTFKLLAKRIKKERGIGAVLFGPIQLFFILRWSNNYFRKGQKSGAIYNKERSLYHRYIKELDIRKVLEKDYL